MTQPDATTPTTTSPTTYRNRLLARLPSDELARISGALERVELERRSLIFDAERPITHVYFVESGLISIVSVMNDASAVETATIGCDGMIGLPVFHGADRSAEQAMTQIPGHAYRMTVAEFTARLPELPTLSMLLHRCAAFLFTLAAQTSGCNRKHSVEQRCARWLLIVRDRVDGDVLGLTHDFVSQMLGVRRASVTDTLGLLESRGLIQTARGRIVITDRDGLEAMGCECYRIIASAYDRLLGDHTMRSPLADVESARDGFSTVGDGTPIASSLDDPVTA